MRFPVAGVRQTSSGNAVSAPYVIPVAKKFDTVHRTGVSARCFLTLYFHSGLNKASKELIL